MGNQQGSRHLLLDPSETTRRAPITKNQIIAYLNGAIHDASLNKGKRIRFAQKNRDWLEVLKKLLKEIGYNSWIYKEGKERNVYVLETLCKELDFAFDSSNLTKEEKAAYLKGFFDAEGGVPHNGGRFYIQLVQKNLEKIRLIKKILDELGIESGKIHNPSYRVDPNYWRVFILTNSHRKFGKLIGSFHPIKSEIFRKRVMI